tara:strand:- start:174 stop:491 length:318 start_codon:yes stop_codon:yes gene_type:complete
VGSFNLSPLGTLNDGMGTLIPVCWLAAVLEFDVVDVVDVGDDLVVLDSLLPTIDSINEMDLNCLYGYIKQNTNVTIKTRIIILKFFFNRKLGESIYYISTLNILF